MHQTDYWLINSNLKNRGFKKIRNSNSFLQRIKVNKKSNELSYLERVTSLIEKHKHSI